MARIQAYVSKEAVEKIHVIVEQRRQEGAAETEVSTSSVISMLLELGLRVYEAQMERKDDPFNQTEFNKVILENVLKTQLAMARVLGASTLAPYVADKPKLNNYQQIISEIKESVNDELAKFFIDIDSDSNSE
uniref:conjugal transfer relaxosome DNA-binding protein TraM n=1 Tax=Serratia proteamaculans TaxID=28151 RepID=UPI001F4BDC62|nr:conjugal transfer relaxosome DNA-binding protein TraM [Serratia proteamaculans]ULG15710.1 conjugal transfer protein TraM [Serratia proteamaculans]